MASWTAFLVISLKRTRYGVGVLQLLGDVPGDGLALAIRVGGQVDGVRRLCVLLQLAQRLLFALDDVVLRLEAVVDVHAHLALGQVLDVAHRGLHRVTGAQVLLDGLGLGGRLHHHQVFGPAAPRRRRRLHRGQGAARLARRRGGRDACRGGPCFRGAARRRQGRAARTRRSALLVRWARGPWRQLPSWFEWPSFVYTLSHCRQRPRTTRRDDSPSPALRPTRRRTRPPARVRPAPGSRSGTPKRTERGMADGRWPGLTALPPPIEVTGRPAQGGLS